MSTCQRRIPWNAGVDDLAAMRSHMSKSTPLRRLASNVPTSAKHDRRSTSELPLCGGLCSTSSRSRSQMPAGCQRSPTTRPLSSSTRVWLNVAPTCGAAVSNVASAVPRNSGCQRSSPSRKATNGAEVAVSPTLRARPDPPFSVWISRRRGSRAARSATIAAVSSVDPSSTTTYSSLLSFWLKHRVHRLPDPGADVVRGRDDGDQRCVDHHPSRGVLLDHMPVLRRWGAPEPGDYSTNYVAYCSYRNRPTFGLLAAPAVRHLPACSVPRGAIYPA